MCFQAIVQLIHSLRGWRLNLVILLSVFWALGFLHQHLWSLERSLALVEYGSPSSSPSTAAAAPKPAAPESSVAHEPETPASNGYSIKPIAYVFPQFHPIPENDEFWGTNFTEWVSVKKVTHNPHGLETLRPTEEVGYYNLLDYSTRARYAKLIRDSGFYGIAYHHYWFGRPVMAKVLEAILHDGQPDVPFMLNWANEAWTKRWDGNDGSGILLAQEYGGITDWRVHFDWMVPFFRHPNYIRSGGKVQMMVYKPEAMGHMGKLMFAAWRKWAVEEGLGGLDVIETRLEPDNPNSRGPADAINEFGFRSGGGQDSTLWVGTNRLSRVYHRGARVTWDNTPRHATDGGSSADVFAHPYLWKLSMIELMQRIKLEPNPRGEENFLFVNALNEWAEGNVLEPSLQWGDKYSRAFREAVDVAETLPWADDLIEAGEALEKEIKSGAEEVDVCVIVRAFATKLRWQHPFDLPRMLHSLRAQSNKRWRAVVVPAVTSVDRMALKMHGLDTFDPRIFLADIPGEVLDDPGSNHHSDGMDATDWAIANLDKISPGCASAAYMLVTTSSGAYEPATFDLAVRGTSDIIGFSFTSPETAAAAEAEAGSRIAWDQRCARLVDDGTTPLCRLMGPTSDLRDLGAAFINLERWRREGHKLAGSQPDSTGFLRRLAERPGGEAWRWITPPASSSSVSGNSNGGCGGLVHGWTYAACIRTGRFWLDIPNFEENEKRHTAGCHSLSSITTDFDWDIKRWDMERFHEDPFCLRMSRDQYEKAVKKVE